MRDVELENKVLKVYEVIRAKRGSRQPSDSDHSPAHRSRTGSPPRLLCRPKQPSPPALRSSLQRAPRQQSPSI